MIPPVTMAATPRLQVALAVEGRRAEVHAGRQAARLALASFADAPKRLLQLLRRQSASDTGVVDRQGAFVLSFPDQLLAGLEEDVIAACGQPEELARLNRVAGGNQAERAVAPLIDVFRTVDVSRQKRSPGLEDNLPSICAQVRDLEVLVQLYPAGFRRARGKFAVARGHRLAGAAGGADNTSVCVVVAIDLDVF